MNFYALKMTRFICLAGSICMLVLLSSCQSNIGDNPSPLVNSLAWKMDESRHASLQDIEKTSDWQIFEGNENWGFGPEPIWVRYSLRAALPGETEPWIIRIRPAFLEHLTLYDPATNSELTSGLRVEKKDTDWGTLNIKFQLQPLPYERTVYLKIKTQRSRIILTDAMPLRKAIAKSQMSEWLAVFLITISAVLALWSSTQWILQREKIMGAFALKQWVATAFALSIMGFTHNILNDQVSLEIINGADAFFRIWTIGTSMLFFALLIIDYSPSRFWIQAAKIFLGFVFLLPLLQFIDLNTAMTLIGNVCALIALIMLLMMLLSTPRAQKNTPIPREILLGYLFIYAIVNGVTSIIFLDWMPVYPALLQANWSHIFIDGFVIFLLLQFRAKSIKEQTHEASEKSLLMTVQLEEVRQKMMNEQKRREEQSQFLHMLMHELKTPLSVVSLALGTRNNREENLSHASRAVQDMKSIIDRCILADRSEDPASQEQKRQAIELINFIQEISHTIPLLTGRLEITPSAHPLVVQTDEQLLKIILINLLDNAAHYSDPMSTIFVRVDSKIHNHEDGLQFSISNTPGLAGWPDTVKLFTKYYRSPGAQRESGSGLGLYLSRQLAHSLNGTLVYSPTNQHVEFLLWLPTHPA